MWNIAQEVCVYSYFLELESKNEATFEVSISLLCSPCEKS